MTCFFCGTQDAGLKARRCDGRRTQDATAACGAPEEFREQQEEPKRDTGLKTRHYVNPRATLSELRLRNLGEEKPKTLA